MIVAIDGPAGSGKSTVAKAIAKRCGLTLLDTGAMYRSCALLSVQAGLDVYDPANADAIVAIARTAEISFEQRDEGQAVFANRQDVTTQIRTPEIDIAVSPVSAIAGVREAMVAQQRAIAENSNVVAEGRDIGTVVFPNADVKVFLTADPQARALRRAVQRAGGDAAKDKDATADQTSVDEILADIKRRDEYDSTREVAPLKPAEDAVHIDSSTLSIDEVIEKILSLDEDLRALDVKSGSEEGVSKMEEPARPSRRSRLAKAEKNAGKAEGTLERMHAFSRNSFDDYYDHPMSDYPFFAKAFYALVIIIVGGVTKLFWPWSVEGIDKLAGTGKGRMIVMNHVSALDPIPVVVSCWMHGISVRPIFKSEFNLNTLTTWFFSRIGGIPVNRGTADMKAVRRAKAALERGESILIFPEGTRVKSDDEPAKVHGGFALMAQLAKAPVVPVAIVGARDLLPKGSFLPRFFKRVYVKIGDGISFESLNIKGKKQQIKAIEELAMNKVAELRDCLRAEHPGKL